MKIVLKVWKELLTYTCLFIATLVPFIPFLVESSVVQALLPIGYGITEARAVSSSYCFSLFTGFTGGTIILWSTPFFLPYSLFSSIVFDEKLELLSILAATYIGAVLLSRLIVDTFGIRKSRVKLIGSVTIVLFYFQNPISMQDISAIYPDLLIGTLLLSYLLVKFYRILACMDRRSLDLVKIGLVANLAILGDPRYFFWIFIPVTSILLVSLAVRSDFVKSVKVFTTMFVAGLPAMLLDYFLINAASGGLTSSYASSRTLSVEEVQFFSTSNAMSRVFQLTGNWWPSPILTPPSILLNHSQVVGSVIILGSPPYEVIGSGVIDLVWTLLFFVPLGLSILSLLFWKNNHKVIYFFVPLLIFLGLSSGSNTPIPGLVKSYVWVGQFPVIGPAWSEAFAIPNYFNQGTIAVMLVLMGYAISMLWKPAADKIDKLNQTFTQIRNFQRNKRLTVTSRGQRNNRCLAREMERRKERGVAAISAILILATGFSSWQLYDGGISPGAAYTNSSGYVVPTIGPYTPVNPPHDWLDLYENLSASDNGSYAIAWTPPEGYAYKWSPQVSAAPTPGPTQPSKFYSILEDLANSRATWLVRPLMESFGVRYIIVDNTTAYSNTHLAQFLISCGCLQSNTMQSHDYWLFKDKNASLYESSHALPLGCLSCNTTIESLETSYATSTTSRSTPVFRNESKPGEPTVSLNPPSLKQGEVGVYDTTTFSSQYTLNGSLAPQTEKTQVGGDTNVDLGGRWTLTVFNGTVGISTTPSTLNISSQNKVSSQKSTILVSYGGALFPGRLGIPVPSYNNTSVIVKWSFAYESNSGTNSLVSSVVSNNYTLSPYFTSSDNVSVFHNSWKDVSVSTVIPAGARSFTAQISAVIQGNLKLRNLSLNYSLTRVLPSGVYLIPSEIPSFTTISQNADSWTPNSSSSQLVTGGERNIAIGDNWTTTLFSGTAWANVSGSEAKISSVSSSSPASFLLTNGDAMFPGTVDIAVPSYNNTGVLVNWTFALNASGNNDQLSTEVSTNDYQLQNNFSSSFQVLTNQSTWEVVHESVFVPPGARTFTVGISGIIEGEVRVRNLSFSYAFQELKQTPVPSTLTLSAPEGKYVISAVIFGNGSVTVGSQTMRADTTDKSLVSTRIETTYNQDIALSFYNISVSYVGIYPITAFANISNTSPGQALVGYSSSSETVDLLSPGHNFFLVPNYPWTVLGAHRMGIDVFGRLILNSTSQGIVSIWLSSAAIGNTIAPLYLMGLYIAIMTVFLPSRARRFALDNLKKLKKRIQMKDKFKRRFLGP